MSIPANSNPPTVVTPAEKRSGLDTTESRKLSFWISQLCIIIATVMGVFLAANQGFKQAMEYGNIQSDRSNYYLRLSLENEIKDNIGLVREYMKKIEKGGIADRKMPFALDTFVWESLKSSSSTLETPSDLLSESRNFYRQVAEIHQKVVNNDYGVSTANKKLTALIEHMEKDVLPKFDANLEGLRNRLEKKGINL